MRGRFIMIGSAFLAASAGLAAGVFSLMNGTVDQAVAFTWPFLAVAICVSLVIPSKLID